MTQSFLIKPFKQPFLYERFKFVDFFQQGRLFITLLISLASKFPRKSVLKLVPSLTK